jgi:DNA-binding NtrC family response regulator
MSEAPRILFVDDEVNILRALRRLFRRQPWQQEYVESGREALAVWDEKGPFDVVVSDQRMPGMTGAELLREVRTRHPDSVRIILSGYAEFQSVLAAVNEGAIYKFLTKPWEDEVLLQTVQEAVELVDLRGRCEQLQTELEQQNAALAEANDLLQQTLWSSDRYAGMGSSVPLILDALPVGVLLFGADGSLLQANPAGRELADAHCAGAVSPAALDALDGHGVQVRRTGELTLPDGPATTIYCLWEG